MFLTSITKYSRRHALRGSRPLLPVDITSSETSNMCRWSSDNFSLFGSSFSRSRDCSPLRRQHNAHKIVASFSQDLPVVIFAIKHCVSIPPNTLLAMHPLEVYYLNQAGRGLTHTWGSALFMQPRFTYSACTKSEIFSAVCFGGSDPYCGAGPKLWVARRCVKEARS
jgi:hypothetical protein